MNEMLTLEIIWQRLIDEALRTCPRCSETGEELQRAYLKLREALLPLGIEVILIKKEITPENFKSNPIESNKILISGKAIEEWLSAKTGQSQCCDICGDEECRTIILGKNTYESIPSAMIIKAGLMAAADLLPLDNQVKIIKFKEV